jgi:hypothetical protein
VSDRRRRRRMSEGSGDDDDDEGSEGFEDALEDDGGVRVRNH